MENWFFAIVTGVVSSVVAGTIMIFIGRTLSNDRRETEQFPKYENRHHQSNKTDQDFPPVRTISNNQVIETRRSSGMITIIGTSLIFGCPGLFLCIFGAVSTTGKMPYTTDINGVITTGLISPTVGFVLLCLSLIFIAIPIVVGFMTMRKKPEALGGNDYIPPAA